MKKKNLGKKGPPLSVIGLGTWSLGGPWRYGWGKVEKSTALGTIEAALESGINWIDTAPAYGLGRAESLVGEALRSIGPMFVATKCGLSWNSKGRLRHDLAPGRIRQEIEESLERLKVDCIDLCQIHWPDPKTPIEKSWRELVRLKKKGLVRRLGVCNFDLQMLQTCHTIHPVDSLQPPLSLFNRDCRQDLLPFCRREQIGVLGYSPLFSGLLSGSFNPEHLQSDDWRRRDRRFQQPFLSIYLDAVDQMRPIADRYSVTTGTLAIAWVLHQPGLTAAIVGA
ncbi:aldo/keto reductase, partial [candidate division KSB1 bacterium]|nr:aldo/keto reductase [candidate division KSB1 bacterium]